VRTFHHRRPRAPAPESPPPDEAERLGRFPVDQAFVTGNGFAARCRHVLNYGGPFVNDAGEEAWYFCKTDHLEWFFDHVAPRRRYVLVSHNSDYPVGDRFRSRLRGRNLRVWFAVNVTLRHPKLVPIPIGVPNPGWRHGDPALLRAAQRVREKSELVDVSFSVETNLAERRRCLELTGLTPAPRLPYPEYLARLARSYFCVSPSGYGIDSHRTWEALYLGAVPIVTRSPLTDGHPDLPLIVLDDWADFGSIELTPELHRRVLGGWDARSLSMDRYFERLRRRIASAG
jgi:hypothetical protein